MSKVIAQNGTVHVDNQLFLPALKDTTCEIEQSEIKRTVTPVPNRRDRRFKGGYSAYKMVIEAPVYIKKTFILKPNEIEIYE